MSPKDRHDYAVHLFEQGYFEDAARVFEEILREEENSEFWNDWATAQFALSRYPEAERGYRRALEMDPDSTEAAVNYATLLAGLARWAEAIGLFDRVVPHLAPENRTAVSELAEQCRAQQRRAELEPASR